VGICRGEILAGRLALRADLRAVEHHAHADPARIQQVFWNLIKNALKFTAAGGSVMIRSFNPAPGRLTVEVEDTGVGIDPHILPRIFNAFEQGEMSLTRRFGGLGLGLAISRSIIETHRGKISARSPGRQQGATFSIELATVRAPAPASPQPPIPVGSSRPSVLSILLVEDDPATSQVMDRLLRRGGHAVAVAGTLAEGLQAAAQGIFDLIISDIGLPDGTGLELVTEIRRNRATPAIALTGYGMEDDVERCREAGFNAHLTKPIDYPKLEALIQSLANHQRV
jgi:CheY-like chemotaxis protein